MTNVVDRPTTKVRPPVAPEMKPRRPERAPRFFRWLGWLLFIGAIAAVVIIVVAQTNEEPATAPVYMSVPEGAITADPYARFPDLGTEVTPQVIEDATVSPSIYDPPWRPVEPNTQFPEVSLVIWRASRIGTPLATSVPSVRIVRATMFFSTNWPKIGIFKRNRCQP